MKNKVITKFVGVAVLLVGVLISLVLSISTSGGAYAAESAEEAYKLIVEKSMMQGVYNCYTYNKDNKPVVKREIPSLSGYNGISTLLTGNNTKSNYVPLVSGIGSGAATDVYRYNISSGALDCRQFLMGGPGNLLHLFDLNEGVVAAMGKTVPSKDADEKTISEFVGYMGYDVKEKDDDDGCSWYYLTYKDSVLGDGKKTNKVCSTKDGKLVVDGSTEESAHFRLGVDDKGNNNEKQLCLYLTNYMGSFQHGACTDLGSDDFNVDWLAGVVLNACSGDGGKNLDCKVEDGAGNQRGERVYRFHSVKDTDGASGSATSLSDYSAQWSIKPIAPIKAVSYLSDGRYNDKNGLAVNRIEKRLLYQGYLTGYYGVKVDCTENVIGAAYNGEMNWLDTSSMTMKVCHYDQSSAKNTTKAVNGVDKNGWFKYNSIAGLDALISEIKNLPKDYTDAELAAAQEIVDAGSEADANANSESGKCMNGAAGSLGWIVCPVLEWLGDASEGIYNEYVEPSLRVEPKLITGGDNSDGGVRAAWGTFQNIANIVFVILLLVVIFSQLTGVGIDNYGIKKILPKLIIAVVLINLSYLICELAVDLSNILGNSFQGLFNEMSKALEANSITIDSDTISTGEITGLTGVGLLGALVAGGAAIYLNPAILLSLLVAAVGVAVSIFFLFIILSAREAAVIALIVISPIAVVLYALPNTRRIFDKWWKMFEGMLLVYPICGLLVGAGGYVSKLLLASGMANGSFMGAFTSMIVSIVPIFFIPTVLRGSFSAMGNLGARISGIGQRASGALTGAARNSQAFKGSQERGMERRTRIQAGVDENGNAINVGRLGSFMRGGQRNMARARAQYLKNQDMRGREANLMGVGYDAAVIGQTKRAEADQLANYTTLINDRTRNGEDEAALFNMFDQYMANGNKAGAVAVARIAGRRKDTAANFAKSKLTGTKKNRSGQDVPATTGYDQGLLQSVAKEMTTGENSGNYRASAPVAFEFASQINKAGYDATGNLQANMDYGRWANSGNVGAALEHHVTNSKELVGMKNSSLGEIADMMEQGKLDTRTVDRMRKLARETISNRGTTGVWDTTKEVNINRIAGNNPPFSAGQNGGGQQGGGQGNP